MYVQKKNTEIIRKTKITLNQLYIELYRTQLNVVFQVKKKVWSKFK